MCGEDKLLEVFENSSDNVFSCSGLPSNAIVRWNLTMDNGFQFSVGICPSPSASDSRDTCIISFPTVFIPTRTTADTAQMTIIANNTLYFILFNYTSLSCSILSNSIWFRQHMCDLDLVVGVEGSKCNVSYETDVSPWAIQVICTVSKAFSSRGRYSCQIYEISPIYHNLSDIIPMTTEGERYKSGVCNVTVPLPESEGSRMYQVLINPGRKNITAFFTGISSEIRFPRTRPTHTCPEFVGENRTLNCTCKGDLGQPPGRVLWDFSVSSQLIINNVQRAQNGSLFTCNVLWNGRKMQKLIYTLYVASPPHKVNFTMSSAGEGPTMNESKVVHFSCIVDCVPPPEINIINTSNGAVLANLNQGTSSIQTDVTKVVFTMDNVHCEDTGVYKCIAKSLYWTEQWASVALLVQCKPRMSDAWDSANWTGYYPTLNYTSCPEMVSIPIVSFPTPQLVNITHIKENVNESRLSLPVRNNIITVVCSALSYVSSRHSCNVTVDNMTYEDSGLYTVTIGNAMGDFSFMLQVHANEINRTTITVYSFSIGAVVGGIAAVVVIFVAVLGGVFYVRRVKCQLLEQHSSSVRSVEGRNNIEKSTTEADLRSNYESLNKPDVGITLPYEDLGQCNSSEKHDSEAPDTQPAYEELRMQEVGVASQYEHLNKQTTNPESIVEDGHIYSNSSST